MGRGPNEWIDSLSEQDIPAEVVDWENIIAVREDNGLSDESEHLDAVATIGEPPAAGGDRGTLTLV